jgi:hypothetical protein
MDRGGEPELEALLAEGNQQVSAERVERIFPFPLDSFQRKAVQQFLAGNSVVVCAPTGGCQLHSLVGSWSAHVCHQWVKEPYLARGGTIGCCM